MNKFFEMKVTSHSHGIEQIISGKVLNILTESNRNIVDVLVNGEVKQFYLSNADKDGTMKWSWYNSPTGVCSHSSTTYVTISDL